MAIGGEFAQKTVGYAKDGSFAASAADMGPMREKELRMDENTKRRIEKLEQNRANWLEAGTDDELATAALKRINKLLAELKGEVEPEPLRDKGETVVNPVFRRGPINRRRVTAPNLTVDVFAKATGTVSNNRRGFGTRPLKEVEMEKIKRDWIIENYLSTGLVSFAGVTKIGKSTAMRTLIEARLTGGTFLGLPVKRGKVAAIVLEAEADFAEAMFEMGLREHPDMVVAGHLMTPGACPTYGDDGGWALLDLVKSGEYGLVIVDHISEYFDYGIIDNDKKTFLSELHQEAQAADVCVILVDHSGKTAKPIGGVVFAEGNTSKIKSADAMLSLSYDDGRIIFAGRGKGITPYSHVVKIDGPRMVLDDFADIAEGLTDTQGKALLWLRENGPANKSQIADGIEMSRTATSSAIKSLESLGRIQKVGTWNYEFAG